MANEIIARISIGSRMDQVYLPKNRPMALSIGSYVVVSPAIQQKEIKPHYYHTRQIEPIKAQIVQEIFRNIDAENVIIAGSFLEKGFCFEDIDIIVINGKAEGLEEFIEGNFGLKAHVIRMSQDALRAGLNTDPLFQMALSRFAAKERVIFKIQPEIKHKLLDIHLLKSKTLPEQFEHLEGKDKYKLTRNLFAIKLFLEEKTATKEKVSKAIDAWFGKGTVKMLSANTLSKNPFITKYKKAYRKVFNAIMAGISNNDKQKQAG
ncbi:MAG: hypothetical protein KJ955_05035 [Nanoarchaeota archaeon]|nr:hypothetical protein [Nanoarchaeota archaeon]